MHCILLHCIFLGSCSSSGSIWRTINTEVHAFRVLRCYLTCIGGTKISFGNLLIIPLVTKGDGMTNKKEYFQVLVVTRELIRGGRVSESMEVTHLSAIQWH